MADVTRNKRNNKKGVSVLLIVSVCVLIFALAASAVLILGNHVRQDRIGRIIKDGTVLKGVSVNGIDISGMTEDQVLAVTADIPGDLLAGIVFTMDINGDIMTFSAQNLGIDTDYQAVIAQVLAYGHTGTFEECELAIDTAGNDGIDFVVNITVDQEQLYIALAKLKQTIDKMPKNAKAAFMPWGYSADGMAYQPDVKAMVEANARGKDFTCPDLVKIDPLDTPNLLRYQYWRTNKYIADYIPADANVSRFLHTPEVTGLIVDMDAVFDQIIDEVQSGDFATITVPVEAVQPMLTLADIKNATQLIASWTSSYESHYGYDRNWNVAMMSSIINGVEILPGESWSVNTQAGPRNASTAKTVGWHEAAGIENGGYTAQVGGGVCQLGSTLYNAAIRAGLTIVSSTHHTIPSEYIPLGLDATLSTPKPDLILQNDNTMPVYLVSYINPKEKNVTVEVYGQLPVDPTYGHVIYDYTSDNKGIRYGSPTTTTIYDARVARDDYVLVPDESYVYAVPRYGTEIQTYKHLYSLDGTALCDPIPFEHHKYPVINGITYVYNPDPAIITTPESIPTIEQSPTYSSEPTPPVSEEP